MSLSIELSTLNDGTAVRVHCLMCLLVNFNAQHYVYVYEITSCLLLSLVLSGASSMLLLFVFLLLLHVLLLIFLMTLLSLESTASSMDSLFPTSFVNGFVGGNDFATLVDTSVAVAAAAVATVVTTEAADALLLVSVIFNETLLL